MLQSIIQAGLAVAPAIMLIAIGWTTRKLNIMPDTAWQGVSRVAFYVLGPFFMLDVVTKAELSGSGAGPFIGALLTGEVFLAMLALSAFPFIGKNRPAFASVFQCVVRWNAIVLLAVAPTLFGQTGLVLIALAIAPMTILCNIFSVMGFTIWGSKGTVTLSSFIQGLITNPLLQGSFAGLVLLGLQFHFTEPFSTVVHQLGSASIPLILMCVGAGLNFEAARQAPSLIFAGTALRLVGGPIVMALAGHMWGLSGVPLGVAIACGATPTAAAGYVLAKELGGDAQLMAGLVTVTALLFAFTIPVALALLG